MVMSDMGIQETGLLPYLQFFLNLTNALAYLAAASVTTKNGL